jgi:hypothetical protein
MNFRRSKNDVTPDTRMTPEASMQVGSQLLLAKDPQTGKPVLPLPVILTKFFSGVFDAPEEVQRAIEFDKLASLPGSPLAVIEQTEAMINRYAALLGEDQVQQMRQQLLQYIADRTSRSSPKSLLTGAAATGGPATPARPAAARTAPAAGRGAGPEPAAAPGPRHRDAAGRADAPRPDCRRCSPPASPMATPMAADGRPVAAIRKQPSRRRCPCRGRGRYSDRGIDEQRRQRVQSRGIRTPAPHRAMRAATPRSTAAPNAPG